MNLMLLLSTLLCLAALAIIYWLHNQYHLDILVEPVPPPADAPLISVLIPARNEARNIRRCVEAVLAQTYPNFEVIVLDDRSTDSTPGILATLSAREPRLVVLLGDELPTGWAGKPHALYQAANAAQGDWLCCLDADTFLAPEALAAAFAKARETSADLFTMLTFQITGSFWEKTVLPLVMTALSVGFSPRKTNDPTRRDAIANGQFMLIRRSVYEALGGFESLKGSIVEDKALAERVKWSGHGLILADGRRVAHTRMYTSLAELWEGWTKNIYLGLKDQPGLLALGVFGALVTLTTALFLPLWPLLGLEWSLSGGSWIGVAVILEALLVWGFLVYVRVRVARAMGISGWYALTTPLGAGIFAAMMVVSAWNVLSGHGVTWKGRVYRQRR